MIEIIGYPQGNIIQVNEEKFNLLFGCYSVSIF